MGKDEVKNRQGWFIFVALVSFAVIVAISVYLILNPISNHEKFEILISHSDEKIDSGNYESAYKDIRSAVRYSHEESLWLRLIKRSYLISKQLNDYKYYLEMAELGASDLRMNEMMVVFYVDALLLSGLNEEALHYISKIESPQYQSLKDQVLIRNESLKYGGGGDDFLPDFRGIREQLKTYDDPKFYQRIGEMVKSDELLFDAALLYLKEGEMDQAFQVIDEVNGPRIPLDVKGKVAYDVGRYRKAINYLLTSVQNSGVENWEVLHLLGDSYFMYYKQFKNNDSLEKAALNYMRAASLEDPRGWRSLLSLVVSQDLLGLSKVAYHSLKEGLRTYPESKDLILFFVSNYSQKEPVIAERILFDYLREYPEDPDINLLRLKYFPENLSAKESQSLLLTLYNLNSESEMIARYLLWYFIGIDNRSAKVLIERFRNENGDVPSMDFYEAILAVLDQDFSRAEELFINYKDKSKDDSWINHYNLAMIYYFSGTEFYPQALEALTRAERAAASQSEIIYGSYESSLANIKVRKSEIYYKQNRFDLGDQEIEAALKIDPGNIKAQRMMRRD